MVSIRLVEAFRFSWDRRVVLGIFGVLRIFAEYNPAIPDCPKRIGRELNSFASKVRGKASLNLFAFLSASSADGCDPSFFARCFAGLKVGPPLGDFPYLFVAGFGA
uniref:Uncharacterized protein n=1 Tax=Candidatus Kentrum sp. FW TaxID=2126338 RepID=A0A450SKY1_9GAMM|nr:MAG: hypothetical protein BECKFW1821A_GA0114235_104619 [Candidatus Kentron sp. FW]